MPFLNKANSRESSRGAVSLGKASKLTKGGFVGWYVDRNWGKFFED